MTDPNIQRPSLRVSAACETLDLNDEDIVVVVQGDEPLVTPDMISSLKPLITINTSMLVIYVMRYLKKR